MSFSGEAWSPRMRRVSPALVAVLSLLATAGATLYVTGIAHRHDEARFREAVQETQGRIERRLATYLAILRSTAGMLAVAPELGPQEFRTFAVGLEVRERYPGTLGIGYAQRVRPDEVDDMVAWMHERGRRDFRVWPLADTDMYPIKFIEPMDWRNQRAVGFDMFSNRVRREAMERARDWGRPAASASVRLVQEVTEGEQPGFIIYVPIYTGGVPESLEERREQIRGFAYAPLRIEDLLTGIFGSVDPLVGFEIHEGAAAGRLLFESHPGGGGADEDSLRTTSLLDVAGQPWTVLYRTREAFMARSERRFVPLVAIGGTMLSLFFFAITVSLSRAWREATEKSRALEASRDELRDVAERFRVALKNAPITVYNTDLDLRYRWAANVPAPHSAESMIGKRDDELLPAEDAAGLIELKRQVLRSGVGVRRELRMRLDGDMRYFDMTIEPLRDARGVLTGLTVATIDITDLRAAYEQFRLAAAAVRSLIYDWDLRSERIMRSEGLLDVLGYRPHDAEATPAWWDSRVHPEDRERYRREFGEGMRAKDRFAIEYRVRHRDGRWVDVWDNAIVVRDAAGAAQRIVGNAMNVTEWRRAQRELSRHAEELARSNDDLEDFAYIASHDLKEPLRGIANYARFLEEDSSDALGQEGVERVRTIQRLSQHMYSLLDSLLEFSRVGRTKLAVGDVDLGQVVGDTVSGLAPWLEQEGGRVDVLGPLPVVRADRVRIGQVFSNLIANGIKYNRSAPKVVQVGVAGEGDDGPVLFVRDNGIGIPERHMSKLFHMFKRLHARNQYGGGTGSGLAIAKKIVERHGGRIWLRSREGQGTTFYFTLGLKRAAAGDWGGVAAQSSTGRAEASVPASSRLR